MGFSLKAIRLPEAIIIVGLADEPYSLWHGVDGSRAWCPCDGQEDALHGQNHGGSL